MKIGFFDVRRAAAVAVVVAAGSWLGGCASQQALDRDRDAARSLGERNNELQRMVAERDSEIGLLQKERAARDAALAQSQREAEALRRQLGDVEGAMREFDNRIAGMALGDIDPETDRALQALAAQYPNLIKYDSARGMLRFASDLTFDSGQDAVKDSAKESLGALAKILTSNAAARYEVFIVGHTDSQRISAGTAQRHPTNMHLSAHRAISVRQALAGMGVPPQKIFVAGWGEYRPVVQNTGTGNTPENRRVEIYLTRPTDSMEGGATTDATPAPAPQNEPEISK